jgi:hypothetical protein
MGGSLVRFSYPLAVGDNCKVSMNSGLLCEFLCEVVRVEASNVALRFIDIDTSDEAVKKVCNTLTKPVFFTGSQHVLVLINPGARHF